MLVVEWGVAVRVSKVSRQEVEINKAFDDMLQSCNLSVEHSA